MSGVPGIYVGQICFAWINIFYSNYQACDIESLCFKTPLIYEFQLFYMTLACFYYGCIVLI